METPLITNQDAQAPISTAKDPLKLVRLINDATRAATADKVKYGYDSKIETYDKLYRNQLYDGANQGHLYFECRSNYYRKWVDGMANITTREQLTDTVLRRDQASTSISAEIFTRIIEYCHYYNNRQSKEYDLVIYAGKYGNGFMHVFYNPEADDNQGLPCYEPINPKYIFVSPGAKSLDDAVYVGYKRPVSTASLKQAYPDLDIKPDADISGGNLMNQKEAGKFKFSTTDPNNSAFLAYTTGGTKLSGNKDGKNQSWLTTFYYQDPEKIDLTDENDLRKWVSDNPGFGNKKNQEKTVQKLINQLPMTVALYPYGRKIQKVNDFILEDDPNPYPFLPIVNFGMYPDPDIVWAEGVISLIREPVRNIHLASSSMAANVDFRNRPPFWTTSQNVDDAQSFSIETNQIIRLRINETIQPLAIPAVAGDDVLKLIHFRIGEIESVTGLREALFGAMPKTGAPSGVQLDKLQDASMGALLPIFRRFTFTRREIGERLLWMIQNYMTAPRKMRFINQEENPPQAQQMGINQPGPDDSFINDVMEGDWEYYVDETTGRPFSQAARFQQIEAAAEAIKPFAPQESAKMLLEASKLPGWAKYAKMIDQRYAIQLQMGVQNAERDRQLKQFEVINKAQSDARKGEAMEVKAGAYVKGLESRGILDVAKAMQTGFETMAKETMDSETTPLSPTPTLNEPPAPPAIGGMPAQQGMQVAQPTPLEGGQG